MRAESTARVKIDFRNDLYNHMIGELKHYAEVMKEDDSGKEAERLIRKIERYVRLGADEDGTEFAVMRFFPGDASELIGILAMVASTAIDTPEDHYERLKAQRAEQSER